MALSLIVSTAQPAYSAENSQFKELKNLQQLAQESKQTGLPIMLMFGAEWCEYCHELIEQVFNPMAMGQSYDGKVVHMRHVGVDQEDLILGFNGVWLKKSKWAYQLDADLTPTVLFLDGDGREVAPRIVGITNTHLYAGVIHRNLNIAYKNMNNPYRIPVTPEAYELQLQANQ
ncbi:MAG: thioredoxin family protein [Pseudomonadota bacterium]|nr:thioredoxin family protein [Pseudomonadota bacterium]